MKFFKTLTLLVSIVLFTACSKEDQANNPPNAFTIELKVEGDNLRVNWNAVTDPDGDEVTYSIYLNETLLDENFTVSIKRIQYSTLRIGENTIKVIAKDSKSASVESSAIFTRSGQTGE